MPKCQHLSAFIGLCSQLSATPSLELFARKFVFEIFGGVDIQTQDCQMRSAFNSFVLLSTQSLFSSVLRLSNLHLLLATSSRVGHLQPQKYSAVEFEPMTFQLASCIAHLKFFLSFQRLFFTIWSGLVYLARCLTVHQSNAQRMRPLNWQLSKTATQAKVCNRHSRVSLLNDEV